MTEKKFALALLMLLTAAGLGACSSSGGEAGEGDFRTDRKSVV